MGDSIVAYAKIEDRLRVLMPGYDIDNYGVPMNTPFDMRDRVNVGKGNLNEKILDPCQYGTVVVLGGFNGIWRAPEGKGGALTGLGKLYSKIKQCPVKLIAIPITPYGSYRGWSLGQQINTNIVNGWILSVPPKVDAVVDLTDWIQDPDSPEERRALIKDLTKDGLHLNHKGGAVIADHLYPILSE